MLFRGSLIALIISLGVFGLSLSRWKQGQRGQPTVLNIGGVIAPDFPAGLVWLNTDRPISLKALRGKFVLLDFWTYC